MGKGLRERLARKRHRRTVISSIGGGLTEWVRFKAGRNKPRCNDWDRLVAAVGRGSGEPTPARVVGSLDGREGHDPSLQVAETERRALARPRAPR